MEGDEDDLNGITKQTDETNKTAEVIAKKQQSEEEMIAQSSKQDTRESSVSSTTDTQATNPDQEKLGKVENNGEPTETGRQDNHKEMEIKAAMVISPKEWRYLHNQWLHSIMQAAMGIKRIQTFQIWQTINIPHERHQTMRSKWSHPETMSSDTTYELRSPRARTKWRFSIRLSVNGI